MEAKKKAEKEGDFSFTQRKGIEIRGNLNKFISFLLAKQKNSVWKLSQVECELST